MFSADFFLRLLFPAPCIYCGGFSGKMKYGFCPDCFSKIPLQLHLRGFTWYVFEYDKQISKALKRAKYSGRPRAVKELASMAGAMLQGRMEPDLVTYVPMTRRDRGERGYNQGRIAAVQICKKVGGDLADKALIKVHDNKKQALLDKRHRIKNVRGVFKARKDMVLDRKILLVDDIMTTGSTLEECKNELLQAGASEVKAIVIAYTPPKGE